MIAIDDNNHSYYHYRLTQSYSSKRRKQCKNGNVHVVTFMIRKKVITRMVSIQEPPGSKFLPTGFAQSVVRQKRIFGKLISTLCLNLCHSVQYPQGV